MKWEEACYANGSKEEEEKPRRRSNNEGVAKEVTHTN